MSLLLALEYVHEWGGCMDADGEYLNWSLLYEGHSFSFYDLCHAKYLSMAVSKRMTTSLKCDLTISSYEL